MRTSLFVSDCARQGARSTRFHTQRHSGSSIPWQSLALELIPNGVCVFYYCRTYYKAVRVGGGGEWRTCAMRDDEPRPVWMSLPITH